MSTDAEPTVLVVDDDRDIRETIRLILDSNGYRTLGASNGKEGLLLLGRNAAIGLILLDMMMPVMDGRRFRDAQLGEPSLAVIPVVLITGDGNALDKAAALGVAGHLTKPLDIDDLLKVVAVHSARR